MIPRRLRVALLAAAALGCGSPDGGETPTAEPVGASPTEARADDGSWISWREHLVDDVTLGGVELAGSDGLVMADLDGDGHEDVVSVHESDTEYAGVVDGLVRVSYGTDDPDVWESHTLASGPEAGAAEDAAVGDVNGDGWPDIVVAVELAHLIYLQNPGPGARSERWPRLIPSVTTGRGSFIRAFLADFDRDGRPEVVAANKGDQSGDAETLNAISWFEIAGDPLDDASWVEHELTRVVWPINAQPVDLDDDGDLDVVGGSVAESRIMWFENTTEDTIAFVEHPIDVVWPDAPDSVEPSEAAESYGVDGFNMDFLDLDGDGRTDIVTNAHFQHLVWLAAPPSPDEPWRLHYIGTFRPDELVGLVAADIDDDGDADVMAGGYSRGPRDRDGDVTVGDPLGRLAWFANPGDPTAAWTRHDISRRKRGMFDAFVPRDLDGDGDTDFVSTRGNSVPYDGVFWLEQIRTAEPRASFERARAEDSDEVPLPGSVGRPEDASPGGTGESASPNGTADGTPPPDTIRVMAWNVHHGAGMDSVLDLERIATLIREADPDLVALQEIDSVTARTGRVDQAAELGRLTGLAPVFGRFMPYRGGAYGMALFTRWPVTAARTLRLPDGAEPRSAVAVDVRTPAGRSLRFVGVHLYRTEEERMAQARRLDELVAGTDPPTLLAGDFNSVPGSPVMDVLDGSWTRLSKGDDHLTFPSYTPEREIDFVLLRPAERFEVLEHHLLDTPVASDHRPLVAELVLRD